MYFPGGKCLASEYSRDGDEFQVYTICQSRFHDGLWLGTGTTGLFWYSRKEDRLMSVSGGNAGLDEIHAIYEESDSVLYVATAKDGLHRTVLCTKDGRPGVERDHRYSFYNSGSSIDIIYPMVADGDSVLWLGSRGDGLVKFNMKTREYYVISLRRILGKSVDDILSLCLSRSGILYVGTTAGLVAYDPDNPSSAGYIGREQGMLNDMVHGILEDKDGFLWLSTNRGLVKYNAGNRSFHTYYYTAGVEIGEFCDDAYYRCPATGRLFFGGIGGLLWIEKDTDGTGMLYHDIVLRDVTIDRKPYTLGEVSFSGRRGGKYIRIKGPDASFSFRFSVPDYVAGYDIEYSYSLSRNGDRWSVFSSSNKASFTDVRPGKYIFKIRYKKDVFDTEYRTFSIPVVVVSPWYMSVWAKSAYVFAVLSLILASAWLAGHRKRLTETPQPSAAGREDKDMTGFLSLVYSNLVVLGAENTTYSGRKMAVDQIREAIFSYGYPEIMQDPGAAGCFPDRYAVTEEADISELLQDIASDIDGIEGMKLVIHGSAVCRIYRNAFCLLFYYIFGFLGRSAGKVYVDVSLSGDGTGLRVSVCPGSGYMEDLVKILEGESGGLPEESAGDEAGYGKILIRDAARRVVRNLGLKLSLDRGSGALALLFGNIPDTSREKTETDQVLVITDSSDIGWIIPELLSSDFSVRTARDPEAAFRLMAEVHFCAFLADMRMFAGSENGFMQMLYSNRYSISGTKFIPILSWKTSQPTSQELLRVSDSYLMLPYDIRFVRNVVLRTVYGKQSIVPVYIDELGAMGVNLVCPTREDATFARKVVSVVDAGLDSPDMGPSAVASVMAMSPSRFFRRFKKIFNMTPENFIKNYRIEKASRLLRSSGRSVSEVMSDVGISSRSYFYREFSARFGLTPKEYMQRHTTEQP